MKIIFISIHVEKVPPAFPLAAAVLKAAVKKHPDMKDFEVQLKDYYMPVDTMDIAEELCSLNADFIGFSAYTWNSEEILDIAAKLKQDKPGLRLFTGGPQPTAVPGIFSRTKLFDFIVRGEGESAIAEILLSEPQNITRVLEAGESSFSENDSPYSVLSSPGKYDGILWEVSRGCPYRCAFCYESRGSKKIRTISSSRVEEELSFFKKKWDKQDLGTGSHVQS